MIQTPSDFPGVQHVAKAGLEDVVAGTTSLCFLDGEKGRLLYCGYDIRELAAHSTFAEVAFLLWYGRLPGSKELERFESELHRAIELPAETLAFIRSVPAEAMPMEVLRTAVSSLGHFDPDSGNTARDASLRKAMRLTARLGPIIAAYARIRQGGEPIAPKLGQSIAWNFLFTLSGNEPDPVFVKALDLALLLHVDHEFNASTFAARVTAATLSDVYSSVTSAIGALKGPLHGGANEQVMRMLFEIGEVGRAREWTQEALTRKVKIPGFGHRVYRTEDPRATVLREEARKLTQHAGESCWFEIALIVEEVVREQMAAKQKEVYPNVDFYSGIFYHAMGIPIELYTPLFALGRMVGWTAHILEQWSNNRLIRPRAEYIGPQALPYVLRDAR